MIVALERTKGPGTVTQEAKAVFVDGVVNWGRIVSLVSLGAAICQSRGFECRGSGENATETVEEEIASYLLKEHEDWLVANDYSDGFVAFFKTPGTSDREDLGQLPLRPILAIGAVLLTCTLFRFK
ncbi:putative induced myeloid leukemia cell differentiation protein Mcl-1 -like [Scophthalmus maximus]|nr:putative induced myeloid leukemia cell differentiation protein Mcl-1 -like [Scophthalmus maximus]